MAAQIEQFNANQMNTMSQFNAQQINQQTGINKQVAGQIQSAQISASAQVSAASISASAQVEAANVRAQAAAEMQNASLQAQREQFNAQNAFIAEQARIEYDRKTNLMTTAAENEMNKLNAQQNFQMSAMEYESALLEARDNANYLRQSFENDKSLKTQLYIAAIGNETAAGKDSKTSLANMTAFINGLNLGG